MKKLKLYLMLLMGAALFVPFTSCGDDNDDPDPDQGVVTPPDDMDSPETPNYDESVRDKDYLEETGKQLLGYFNASEQQTLVDAIGYFAEEFEDYDFPENFYDEDNYMGKMRRSLVKKDYIAFSRGAVSYAFSMAPYTGIYEPNLRKYEWERTGDSDACILRYKDDSNRNCEIKVEPASKSTWTYARTIEGDRFNVEVPKVLRLTFARGGENLLTTTVNSDFSDGRYLNISSESEIANFTIVSNAEIGDKTAKASVSYGVNGTRLISGSATIEGNNLCSVDKWENTYDRYGEDEAVQKMITGGNGVVNILNRINLNANVTDVEDFIKYMDYWVDSDDSKNPEADAKNAAKLLGKALNVNMTYAGSNKVRADIVWEPYLDWDWTSWDGKKYEAWALRPLLHFTSDDTTYDFESYFGEGRFYSIERLFESICNDYEKLID